MYVLPQQVLVWARESPTNQAASFAKAKRRKKQDWAEEGVERKFSQVGENPTRDASAAENLTL